MTDIATPPKGTRGSVRVERGAKRIRAYLGGRLVADTTRPLLVWEKPFYPAYYVPASDVRAELAPTGEVEHSPSRGEGEMLDVRVGDNEAPRAALALRGLADRGASRRDPFRVVGDGRLVRGGRGGVRAPAQPVHAGRHPAELTARPRRDGRRCRRDDGADVAVRDRTAAALLPAEARRPMDLLGRPHESQCPYKGQARVLVGRRRRRPARGTRLVVPDAAPRERTRRGTGLLLPRTRSTCSSTARARPDGS